jgi:sphinganine-1-phosphate aldolase
VYHPEDKHWDFVCDIMRQYIVVNPLHCEEFLPVTQMEAEIIRMVCNLYKGDSSTCGIGTGGGTESILLGMLAHREWAKNERGVVYPNIVVSETAHVAFEKAGFYFGIEVRKVPVNADLSANVAGMKKQIDSNTVCLVASACEYPFGNIDPVPEIAALALRYDVGCHVDACLGGFINPFAEEAGFPLPCIVDFRNPGVTSISVDTHKYAYGPKGYSVCMFKNAALRNSQLFSAM